MIVQSSFGMFEELFNQSGLSLDRLHSLCEVAEKGSIGEATKGDSNRQTLVSRQITELERFFGTELLNRETRPHRLNDEGWKLVKLSKTFFRGLSDFQAGCSNRPVIFRIGSGDSSIQWLLMPNLEFWKTNLPGASIQLKNLRTLKVVEELISGDIDLALLRKSAVTKPLKSISRFRFEYRLFVPKKMKRKLDQKIKVGDFSDLPLAVVNSEGEFWNQLVSLAEAAGIELNVQLELSSLTQVAGAIQNGSYCGFLPAFATSMVSEKVATSHEVAGFESLSRELVFAWNPKKAAVRPIIEDAIKVIEKEWGRST